MVETKHSSISSLAALLVERDGEMKVVILTTGTKIKRECSYSSNNTSADECMWDHCDGHAVSVCYRLSSLYLITEMYRYEKNQVTSILEMLPGGYRLKKGVNLHIFSTKLPCGFMAEDDSSILSWKIPFKRKPHCLECSSTIAIGAYLGIQGPLSHLFQKPVYISSIIIPKYENVTALKVNEIKKHFENFALLFNSPADSDYKLKIPNVEIAEVESTELFPECFEPWKGGSFSVSQTIENQAENHIAETAGTVPDTDDNVGSHVIIFSLKNRIGGEDFRKKMASQLKDATKDFKNEMKKSQLKSLKQAHSRLSQALNAGEALVKLKTSLIEKKDRRFITHNKRESETEQSGSINDEVTLHIHKMRKSLCVIIKEFENNCDIQEVKEFLPSLKENFETNSKLVIENLVSLNGNMKKLENDTKSIVDVLTNYRDYQETLDALSNLLEKSNTDSCDPLGCDWARHLRAMDNDIEKGKLNLTLNRINYMCML